VRMPSLLLIAIVVLFCGGNAHAQSPYTQRFASSSSEGGKEQQKTRRNINKSDAEWTFATPASKGLSQSSLEVRFAILSFISRSCSFPYSPRPPFQREEEEAPGMRFEPRHFPFLKRGRAHFWGANLFSLSLSLEIARARTRRAIDFDAFAFFLLFHFRFRVLTARTLSRFHIFFFIIFYRPPMRVFPSFPGETASWSPKTAPSCTRATPGSPRARTPRERRIRLACFCLWL